MSFDEAVVAVCIADGRNDRVVALLNDGALRYGCCAGEVGKGCLGCPIACCYSCGEGLVVLSDCLCNDDLHKDSVIKTKSAWVQIEVSLRWGVIGRRIVRPDDRCEVWSRFTIRHIAKIIGVWWICPDVTSRWLGGVTDITG